MLLSVFNFFNFYFINLNIKFDAAEESQLLFQCPATHNMDNIIDLHHDIFSLMLILAAITFYLIGAVVYKFRAGNSSTKRNFNFTHDTLLEIIWTLIPMAVLLFILAPSFVLLYSIDELHDSLLTLKVLGRQWYWTYEYTFDTKNDNIKTVTFDSYLLPDSDLSFGAFRLLEVDNRVRLPVETFIRVLVTSTDVLHSWAIPSFGVKMDACPGRLNQLSLFIYRMGVFYGQCSEICGINHGFMPIVVEGIISYDFLKWLNSAN